jgi:hypothetical protein
LVNLALIVVTIVAGGLGGPMPRLLAITLAQIRVIATFEPEY